MVMVKPFSGRLIFAELKSAKGITTEMQHQWLMMLEHVPNIEVYLWRPSHWDLVLRVLGAVTHQEAVKIWQSRYDN